mmetsp:Transcript_72370/g.195702  ORF Transcript_72370/g.195702 Transcript_72370/m.195702 type:complete len:209 (+) Transcript_72370:682-1308(+)
MPTGPALSATERSVVGPAAVVWLPSCQRQGKAAAHRHRAPRDLEQPRRIDHRQRAGSGGRGASGLPGTPAAQSQSGQVARSRRRWRRICRTRLPGAECAPARPRLGCGRRSGWCLPGRAHAAASVRAAASFRSTAQALAARRAATSICCFCQGSWSARGPRTTAGGALRRAVLAWLVRRFRRAQRGAVGRVWLSAAADAACVGEGTEA